VLNLSPQPAKKADNQGRPVVPTFPLVEQAEQDEALRTSIQAGTVAQIAVALSLVLGICYFAKLPLVVLCVSAFLAFVLDPVVRLCEKIRLPRSVGAIVALILLAGVLYGLSYFFYARASEFAQDVPKIASKVKSRLGKYRQETEQIQRATESVAGINQPTGRVKANQVIVQQETPGLAGWLQENFGTVSEVVFTTTLLPFLTYFMLTWGEHARRATVRLFGEEHRRAAYRTLGKISDMMKDFIVGNLYIGLFMSAVSVAVFGLMGLPFFYFTGVLSGFLSVVPYLGVLLALVPPLATELGHLTITQVIIISVTVFGSHLFSLNVLYPKLLGSRLQLNPLVVTISLLMWGWLWGAMGLILAVPITAAVKIVCDNVEQLKPLGDWMGE
jgi:predicted PurR-regulated permease PerM